MKEQQRHALKVTHHGRGSTSVVGDHPQFFQVEGNLYYHREPEEHGTPPALFPLSPIPEPGIFIGREHALEEMEAFFLDDSEKVFLLEGIGGIGKTVFAAHACRKFRHYFQDIYWTNSDQDASTERFIGELYSFFLRNHEHLSEQQWYASDMPLRVKIHTILHQLEEGKYLLVFDNLQTILDREGRLDNPELRDFFQELIWGGHQSKLLYISRRSVRLQRHPTGICRRKRLARLHSSSTKKLLKELGMPLAPCHFRILHKKAGGHPRALRLLAELYERRFPLQQLLSVPFYELSNACKELCDDLLAAIWDTMGTEEREVLQALATYQIPVPPEALGIFVSKTPGLEEDCFNRAALQQALVFLDENCVLDASKAQREGYLYTLPYLIREWTFRNLTKVQQQEHHRKAAAYLSTTEWGQNSITFEELQRKEEAIYHAVQAGDFEQATRLNLALSEGLRRCGLGTMARGVLLKTAENLLTDEDYVTSYNQLGNIHVLQGNYIQALLYYKQARRIQERLDDEESLAAIDNNIAAAYAARGEYQQALWYYKHACICLERLQCEPQMATVYNNIGFTYANQTHYEQALRFHEKACEIQERLQLEADLASSYTHIGFIHSVRGDTARAFTYYDRGRTIRERLGLEVDLAESYNNLGTLYADQHQFQKAIHYYTQAREILERLELEVNLARTHNNIGSVYAEQRNFASALQSYQQARDIQKRLGLQVDLATTYHNMGVAYTSWDRQRYAARALACHEQAREIQEYLGLYPALTLTFEHLADLYDQEGDYRKAEHALTLSIMIQSHVPYADLEEAMAFLARIRQHLAQRTTCPPHVLSWIKCISNTLRKEILS